MISFHEPLLFQSLKQPLQGSVLRSRSVPIQMLLNLMRRHSVGYCQNSSMTANSALANVCSGVMISARQFKYDV
ncbi:MAG: hypothetical protein M2R45_04628 [Verrucomicrobia subdivision 3 bacterium]|nr:hypothetical protein [Limisphaerales bacterium]MCS1417120.1 hypothetical protein [Limisphaerales bacterium]